MNTDIEVKKSKKRKHFLDVKIRNNILLELLSTQVFQQYKNLDLTIPQLPLLVMDIFQRIHSKQHLTDEERNTVTKSIILKLYPFLKSGNPLNKENLKLADIDIVDDSPVDPDVIELINNLVDCFAVLKSRPLIQKRGCIRGAFRFLKALW